MQEPVPETPSTPRLQTRSPTPNISSLAISPPPAPRKGAFRGLVSETPPSPTHKPRKKVRFANVPRFTLQDSHPSASSSNSSSTDLSVDLHFCNKCHLALFCSPDCLVLGRKTFHNVTCDMDVEFDILRDGPSLRKHPAAPRPQLQTLHKLLLYKVLANALIENEHPLRLPFIRLIPSCLAPAEPVLNDKTLPWSYATHVQAPLMFLYLLGGDEGVLDVERFDGWVLNTLLAKIAEGTQVEGGPSVAQGVRGPKGVEACCSD